MTLIGYPVKIPNDDTIPVKSVGNTRLPNRIEIKRVLNIPDFKWNLLFVSRLTRELNCVLIFFPDFCVLQDSRSKNVIGVGKNCDGLYCLEPMKNGGVAMAVKSDSTLWHRRLGHASSEKLQKLHFPITTDSFSCDPCFRSKQNRLSFRNSSIKTKHCFELIHCDIWGGYKTPSLSEARFFIYC